MESLDPTQVVTIGGLALVTFILLIRFLMWYIKRVEDERSVHTERLINLVTQSDKTAQKTNQVLEQVIESQDKNTKATEHMDETMKTQADFAKLLVEMMRGRDKI